MNISLTAEESTRATSDAKMRSEIRDIDSRMSDLEEQRRVISRQMFDLVTRRRALQDSLVSECA